MNNKKYKVNYYLPPIMEMDWIRKDQIEKAPIWCSVDLRDGNQALVVPMNLEEKIEFFKLLVKIGFKEIEVGFPAASETEYQFLRALIEQNLIPDDVTIQVLTQAREHIIEKTFKSLEGINKAIVHLYNSTSYAQREQVFKKSKEEIIEIAKTGAELVKKYALESKGNFRFEYSPESFTGTEMEFALDICNEVLDIWKPHPDKKVIINLPSTVQESMPHIYASQIEYMSKNLKYRECVEISLHPHNDRGTGVGDAELGLLAGADRIEGTLFGNGERTGNVDIVTLALNMYSHGLDPKLNFSNILEIVELYEKVTKMKVYERQPYSGKLVFAAFSGSHQDAIAKGMKWNEENSEYWTVPYLPIDPTDLGRIYEADVIRINSQSGKGGIGYLLEQSYGYQMPPKMKEIFGYRIKDISDKEQRELLVNEINQVFTDEYININSYIEVMNYKFEKKSEVEVELEIRLDEIMYKIIGKGNGHLDAVSDALSKKLNIDFDIVDYKEHALSQGSDSKAVSYVEIKLNNCSEWGVGIHTDIIDSSILALVSAINRVKNINKN